MLKGDKFSNIFYGVMLMMTGLKPFVPIHPAIMTFISTGCIVYIGSVLSTKILVHEQKIKTEKIETMKQKDALMFPVIGSAVLGGLYLIFKYFDKDYLNLLFGIYCVIIGGYSISQLIVEKICNHPRLKKYNDKHLFTIPKVKYIVDEATPISQLDAIIFVPGLIVGLFYFFSNHWMLNNVLGVAFCLFGIENMILGEYKSGLILLVLLFFYDIFWVFFTPVMVTVAKKLNGPIKLMFPKKYATAEIKDFNMIGLGDIVIPGVYIAMMMRFDIILYFRRHKTLTQLELNFSEFKHFWVTYIFYNVGILLTLVVMYVFNHAQPALLYLVPCILVSSTLTAVFTKNFKALWDLDEEKIQKNEFGYKEKEEKKEEKKDENENKPKAD